MTTYVLLEFPDDDHARTLVEDMREYPDHDLLTPCQEHFVHARLVYAGTTNPIRDECDTWANDRAEPVHFVAHEERPRRDKPRGDQS